MNEHNERCFVKDDWIISEANAAKIFVDGGSMVGPVHRDIYVYLLKRITRCFKRAFPDVIEFRKRCYFEKRS